MAKGTYKGIVQSVVPNGSHGPYAIATAEGIKGSVTFALAAPVWNEENLPEEGTYVVLSKVVQKRAGWRAQLARYYTPDDEKPEEKQK